MFYLSIYPSLSYNDKHERFIYKYNLSPLHCSYNARLWSNELGSFELGDRQLTKTDRYGCSQCLNNIRICRLCNHFSLELLFTYLDCFSEVLYDCLNVGNASLLLAKIRYTNAKSTIFLKSLIQTLVIVLLFNFQTGFAIMANITKRIDHLTDHFYR